MSNIKTNEWRTLGNSPITMALFQMKFAKGDTKLDDFLIHEEQLRESLPYRKDNIEASINFHSSPPLGTSKITGTSNAHIQSYTYLSEDKKSKLIIGEELFTYIDEHPYKGWDTFKPNIRKYIELYASILKDHTISQISLRYINQFIFGSFENPTEYFKTLVSTTEEENQLPFPLLRYGFKLVFNVPDTEIHSVVNQNLVNDISNKYYYLFDIDVVSKKNQIFGTQAILDCIDEIREIKNTIFFTNVTSKTLDLCS